MLKSSAARSAIDHAVSLGADFVDVFAERNQVSTISTLTSAVQDIGSGIEFGIGIRLVYGSKVLYGFTNRTEVEELQRIVSDLAAKDRRDPASTAQAFDYREVTDLHAAYRSLSCNPETESKVAWLLAADRTARDSSNCVSQVRGSCGQREQAIEIFNSEGLHVRDTRHYTRLSVNSIATDGTRQATGTATEGALQGWELSETIEAEELGAEATRQALVNLEAKPCPSGRMPVVIGNGFGGVIFHEACGHSLETTSVAKKASEFHDRMGDMIANPVVNAVDDGTLVREWGSINIDDEGMATERTQLIREGRLVNFLADRIGFEQTGYPRTGSGRRQGYAFAPASRMRNTFIEPGEHSFDDMIASVPRGIYAAHMGGGSVQPGTGEFNFAVTEGYYVEDGRIRHPVQAATLIGKGCEVLEQISMVGKDIALATGMCGSVSGAVPVTVGQPTIKVEDILVGGND